MFESLSAETWITLELLAEQHSQSIKLYTIPSLGQALCVFWEGGVVGRPHPPKTHREPVPGFATPEKINGRTNRGTLCRVGYHACKLNVGPGPVPLDLNKQCPQYTMTQSTMSDTPGALLSPKRSHSTLESLHPLVLVTENQNVEPGEFQRVMPNLDTGSLVPGTFHQLVGKHRLFGLNPALFS